MVDWQTKQLLLLVLTIPSPLNIHAKMQNRCLYLCCARSICQLGRFIKWQLCNIIKSRSFIIIGLHWGAFHFPAKHPKSRADFSLSQSTVIFNTRQQRGNLFGLHHKCILFPLIASEGFHAGLTSFPAA